MNRTAIVLAGGFGTRLQSVVKDLPKPMADIAGKPFLEYLLRYLQSQGLKKIILSVGYKWESIFHYFGNRFDQLELHYVVEDEPLGTGGAILKAIQSSDQEEFFIFNGDTFFFIELAEFYEQHQKSGAVLSIALKPMKNFDRYGVVKTDSVNRILSFNEKRYYEEGNINAGVYLLNRNLFNHLSFPKKFSFEKDLMEKHCAEMDFRAFAFADYFIDIGIPEDYARARQELPSLLATQDARKPRWGFQFDKSWTLFLDRDGVLNRKIDGDYVRDLSQFEWLPGVKESLVKLSRVFGRIIIVSNQQGVGKKLMTLKDVETIHDSIVKTVHDLGGRIDQIYFAPQLKEENSAMRKPGTGMALQAREDFPDINFSKSVMVGDSMSDMEFGRNAGMKTVFISHGNSVEKNESIDAVASNFADFAVGIA